MEQEITQVLALGLRFLPEAALLTALDAGQDKVIFINPAFERLSGYSLEELRGPGLNLLQGPETDRSMLYRLLQPSDLGILGSIDVILYGKGERPFWDRIRTTRFESLNTTFRVQIHEDVTHQKGIEKQLVLVQRHEVRGRLVSELAHDFNNLLAAIQVYSGLLAARVKNDVQLERYANEIHSSAEGASQFVTRLQSLERPHPAEPEWTDVHKVVKESGELLQRALGDEIRLNIKADPKLNKVRAHPAGIQQILLNLAFAARGAMPHGGEMLVRLVNERTRNGADEQFSQSRNFVLLLVHNSGRGIDAESLAKGLKSSFGLKATDNSAKMRLFVTRTIVEQYRGSIHLESETGKWATFKILLPAAGTEESD